MPKSKPVQQSAAEPWETTFARYMEIDPGTKQVRAGTKAFLITSLVLGVLVTGAGLFVFLHQGVSAQVPSSYKGALLGAGGGFLVISVGGGGALLVGRILYYQRTDSENRLFSTLFQRGEFEERDFQKLSNQEAFIGKYLLPARHFLVAGNLYLIAPLKPSGRPLAVIVPQDKEAEMIEAFKKHGVKELEDPFGESFQKRVREEMESLIKSSTRKTALFSCEEGSKTVWVLLKKGTTGVDLEFYDRETTAQAYAARFIKKSQP